MKATHLQNTTRHATQGSVSLLQVGILLAVASLTIFMVSSRMNVLKGFQSDLSKVTISEQQALGLVQRYAMKKIQEFRTGPTPSASLEAYCLQEPLWKTSDAGDSQTQFAYRCSLVNATTGLFRFDGSFDQQRVLGSVVYGFSTTPLEPSDCPGLPSSGCPATVTTNPKQWGNGTELDPYCICHPSQLDNLTPTAQSDATLLSKYFKLARDLDMTQSTLKDGENNKPIGSSNRKFTGVLFGNLKTIRNFKFIFNEKSTSNTPNVGAPLGIGLFRQLGDWATTPIPLLGSGGVYRAIIKDLKIENIEILNQNVPNTSTSNERLNTGGPVGGLAGLALFASIDGVQVSGKIGFSQDTCPSSTCQAPTANAESFPSHQATGGVVGLAIGTRIQNTELKEINTTTASKVHGLYHTGGIVGHLGPPESLGVSTVFPKPTVEPFGTTCNWNSNLGQCPLPFVMSSVVEKSSVHGASIVSLANVYTGPGYTGGIAGRSVDSPIKEVRVFQESGAPPTVIRGVNRVGGIVGAILKDYLRPNPNWELYPNLAEDDGTSFPDEPQLCPNSCTTSGSGPGGGFGGGGGGSGTCAFGVMVYPLFGLCHWCGSGMLRLFRPSCEGATIESGSSYGVGGIAGITSIVRVDQAFSSCTVKHLQVTASSQYNPFTSPATNYLGMGGLVGMIHHSRIHESEFSGALQGGNARFNFMGGIFGNLYGPYSSGGNPSNSDGADGNPHSSDLCMTQSSAAIPGQHTCLRRQLNLQSFPEGTRVKLRHSHNKIEATRMSGLLQGVTSALGSYSLNLRFAGIGNVNSTSTNTQSLTLERNTVVATVDSSNLNSTHQPLTITGGVSGVQQPFIAVKENLFRPRLSHPQGSQPPTDRLLVADIPDAFQNTESTDNFICRNFHQDPIGTPPLRVLTNSSEDDGNSASDGWNQLEDVGFFRAVSPFENVTQYTNTSPPPRPAWDVWKQTQADMMGNASGLDIDRPWRIIWRVNLTDATETPYTFNNGLPVPKWCVPQSTPGPTGNRNVCKPF